MTMTERCAVALPHPSMASLLLHAFRPQIADFWSNGRLVPCSCSMSGRMGAATYQPWI